MNAGRGAERGKCKGKGEGGRTPGSRQYLEMSVLRAVSEITIWDFLMPVSSRAVGRRCVLAMWSLSSAV